MKNLLVVGFLFLSLLGFAQNFGNPERYLIDSLNLDEVSPYDLKIVESSLDLFHSEKNDSLRLTHINTIVEETWDDGIWPRYNEWILNYTKSQLKSSHLNQRESNSYKNHLADALNNAGFYYSQIGENETAIEYYNEGLDYKIKLSDSSGVALILNNMAGAYESMNKPEKYLQLNYKALEIREALGDEFGIAQSCNNIASLHDNNGNDSLALIYYFRSFEIRKKINDINGLCAATNNIASIYSELDNKDSAIYFCFEAIRYSNLINNPVGLGYAYNNLGFIYNSLGMLDSAAYYYSLSYASQISVNNKRGAILSLSNLAAAKYRIWKKNNNHNPNLLKDAIKDAEKSFELAMQVNSPASIINPSQTLALLYSESNESSKKTYDYLNLYYNMRDSTNNLALHKSLTEEQTKYEYDKQKVIDDAERDKAVALEQAAKKNQQAITYIVLCGLILLVIFLIIIVKRLKITKAQNVKIEQQKEEIHSQHEQLEETHNEIKDSINYAKRIQGAILPSIAVIQEHLKNALVLYLPKDVVAGDFYWFEKVENRTYIASADCTGHGVPGALVSVVCNNALNKSLFEFKLKTPAEILDKTRELVIEQFQKSDEIVKDGMDIALCCIEDDKILFAGANNPLLILRNNEFIEIKADKQPVGNFEHAMPFTNHSIDKQTGDTIFLFSDGYIDQFGGEKGKKLKSKGFKDILISSQKTPVKEREEFLTNEFIAWRGPLEQIDDVCIISFEV